MRSHLARLKEAAEPVGLGPAEAVALLILLAGAVSLTAVVWWGGRAVPGEGGAAPDPLGTDSGSSTVDSPPSTDMGEGVVTRPAPTASAEPSTVVVHVAGEVGAPGLITLPDGARVADAVQAAGGLTADGSLLTTNLARVLVDGEQIVIPMVGAEPPPAPSTADPPAGGGEPRAEPLDLNTATLAELEALPGLGPVMARRILDHRERIGGFVDTAQLLEVPGIGPARFADLEPRVRV